VLLTSEALAFTAAFAADPNPVRALAARGRRQVGAWTLPVGELENLDHLLRELPQAHGASPLPLDAAERLGWPAEQLAGVLKALGFAPARKPVAGQPSLWRRRRAKVEGPAPAAPAPASPFAALAALNQPPPRRSRRPRRRKPRAVASKAASQ
jgi:ATP-dependent RNA helicase SUPV3L1/SUV3